MRLASSGHRPAAAVVCAASLALGVSGCSADADADDGATEARSAPAARTSPSAPARERLDGGQALGRYGVTYEIRDWSRHRDDVLAVGYKSAFEAFAGSVNSRQATEGLRTRFARPLRRELLERVQFAWGAGLHVDPVARVRVVDSERSGTRGRVTVCQWVESADFKTADETLYGQPEPGWEKVAVDLDRQGRTWRVTEIDSVGRCPGGAPR